MNKQPPNYKSLLWKISGKNLKKASYVFGTMHLICAEDFLIKDKVQKAFKKCDALFMEVDLANMDEMEIMSGQEQHSNSISAGLSESEQQELDEILQTNYGFSLKEADMQPPITLLNQMIVRSIGCDEMKVFEMEFIQMASEANMQTGGLETALEQLGIADEIYDSKELLRQLRIGESYSEVFQNMLQAYKAEDLNTLNLLVNDRRFMSEDGEEIMLIRRNKNWASLMPQLMQEKAIFFAVGAGHLGQEYGILHLLREQGYNVNPVYR
ncbi:MAG: TraB/GumN family protein [Ginsengibacter sp.]